VRLTTRARYALQLMVSVARLSDGGQPVSLDKVSKRTRLSRRYLEHLAAVLRKSSLLRSVPGRSGGYLLARAGKAIRVGQIIEACIGPMNIVECVRKPEVCLVSAVCECRPIYQILNRRITEVLNEYSLADVADAEWLATASRQLATTAVAGKPRGHGAHPTPALQQGLLPQRGGS
jgi:Rrf2 family iron-sulfur cluster assembly transcriptional regulator